MIIDIHVHEKTFSADSGIGLEEIVEEARRKGLDGVCVTDHDSNGISEIAFEYQQKCGFTIFVGAEICDILVFGIDELPDQKMHAGELLSLVINQGGVGIAAHPYRDNNRGLGDNIKILSDLAGIEVLNGRTEPHNNVKALEAYQQYSMPGFGGSDAHQLDEVGKCATYFPHGIKTEADFIKAVKSKRCEPVFYENGVYRKVKRGLINEKVFSFNSGLGFCI
ncbi:MAG: PHP domain-containing protein [Peptococcaceae bacterium]|nr:PHP domain-containing protein [Peptococcaceae bacterium]